MDAIEVITLIACLDMLLELSKSNLLPQEIENKIPEIAEGLASDDDGIVDSAVSSFCKLMRSLDSERYKACFGELFTLYPKHHRKSDGWCLGNEELLAANKTEWVMFLFFKDSTQKFILKNLSGMLKNKTIRYSILDNFFEQKRIKICYSQ